MSDTTGYPTAQPVYDPNLDPNANPDYGRTAVVPASVEVNEQGLTAEETAAADMLYDELKPQATAVAREYVLARTPANMQEYMVTKIEADWPVPPAAEDPNTMVRVQGEQGRVSVQKPAISDNSPQVARKGQKVDIARAELDTNLFDANRRRLAQ